MAQRVPAAITVAMLTPANPHIGKPRYDTAADWSQGATGNDVDVATLTTPVVGSDSAASVTPYPIRTQTAKAAAMAPARSVLGDFGKDYGTYAGQTGRKGPILPGAAYPTATSVPGVLAVTPAGGPAAGGTAVTIYGIAFTSATGVTFGGTAATAVVVVDASTITCVAPAHAAGLVDVRVTTPNGTTPAGGGGFTYA